MLHWISKYLYLLILSALLSGNAEARTLKVCVGSGSWWPYSLNNLTGMHVDVVNAAAAELGWKVKWELTAWKRCLLETAKAKYDGALSAGWSAEREKDLIFPKGAESEKCNTLGMLDCESTAIMIMADSKFEYNGNLKTLPRPIRIPLGYVQIPIFEKKGVSLDIAPADRLNILKLSRDKAGCILITGELANYYMTRPQYKNKFRITKRPFDFGPSYIAMSRKNDMKKNEIQRFFKAISNVTSNKSKMAKIRKTYFDNPPAEL